MWIGVPSAASPRRPVRYYTAPVNQLPRIVITSAPATSSSIPGPKSYDRSLLNFPLLSFPFFPFFWLFELGRSLCFLSLSCFSPILSLGHSLKLRSHALVCFCCCHSPPPSVTDGATILPPSVGISWHNRSPSPWSQRVDCQSSSESVDHFQS